jgi:hypothetical protein
MNRTISPEIERGVKQSTLSLYGEDGNDLFDMARIGSCFRGSYLRHVINGGHGNKGDPTSSLWTRVEPNKLKK